MLFASSRQMKRLDAVSRSPVYQIFSESLKGLLSVRAFGAEERLLYKFALALNKNHATYICIEVLRLACLRARWCWRR